MAVLLNDETTINTSVSQPESINTSVSSTQTLNTSLPDINYIPGYKAAEEERRANEVVRQSNEEDRQNYYSYIQEQVDSGAFNGQDGQDGQDGRDGAIQYTAGTNIQISDENVISATDTTYTAGTGIDITNGVISNTQTSANWGNITGTLSNQTDLQNALNDKASSSDLATLENVVEYSGKNLFDGNLELGGYKNDGTKDTSTNLYRSANFISVQPDTEYTTSIDGVKQRCLLCYYDENKNFLHGGDNIRGSFMTDSDCYYITFYCFQGDFTNDYGSLKYQLEKGSTATDYEPYTNGVKTPKFYTKSETNSLVKYSGKNLFGDTIAQGVVTANGFSNVANRIRNTQFIKVQPNQIYSLSYETSNGINQYNISYFENDSFPRYSETGWTNTSFAIPNNCNYIMISFSKNNGANVSPSDISNIQLEKGSPATDYEPYTGGEPAYKFYTKPETDDLLSDIQTELKNLIKTQAISRTVTMGAGVKDYWDCGSLSIPTGYKYIGILQNKSGSETAWVTSWSCGGENGNHVYAQVYNFGNSSETKELKCTILYIKDFS